jgi:hypothetical protein
MRIPTFLCVTFLLTAFLFAEMYFPDRSPASQHPITQARQTHPEVRGGDGERMWTRAQIRVMPLDLLMANRVELESLRSRAARSELDASRLSTSNPAVREQLSRQIELLRALLDYADRQDSDNRKSPVAIEVQRHLNGIEGRVNCEACHTGVVAKGK